MLSYIEVAVEVEWDWDEDSIILEAVYVDQFEMSPLKIKRKLSRIDILEALTKEQKERLIVEIKEEESEKKNDTY